MTITLEEYRRREQAGEIRRPLTWGQTITPHMATLVEQANTRGTDGTRKQITG